MDDTRKIYKPIDMKKLAFGRMAKDRSEGLIQTAWVYIGLDAAQQKVLEGVAELRVLLP